MTIVPESSTESEKSGLPPRPRRLFRSKRIYEEPELMTKENVDSVTGKNVSENDKDQAVKHLDFYRNRFLNNSSFCNTVKS